VSAAALQPDGNILITGGLITTNGATRLGIARLYGDSTLPTLSIAQASGSAVLSWPAAFSNYHLEWNTNISVSNGWSSIITTRSTNNGFISVTIPATNSGRFFRLGCQ